jgi:hypothetical protein
MRRYFMAVGTSLLAIALLFACYVQGALPVDAFFKSTALVLLAAAVFYVVFRSGLNRKMKDPSLTIPQMTAATLVVLYAMYSAPGAFLCRDLEHGLGKGKGVCGSERPANLCSREGRIDSACLDVR